MVSKFCRQFVLLCAIVLCALNTRGESGIGCVIETGSGGVIYITEFGDTNWHGQKYRVYNRFGATYLKVYNPVTSCGQTSSANVTPYTGPPAYNGTTQCWVSNFHNPDNNDSTVGGYGAWVQYTSVTPCPLDKNILFVIVIFGILGVAMIRSTEHI